MIGADINTRILVIDDEEAVRDSFRTVLAPRQEADAAIREASSVLFDEPPRPGAAARGIQFQVDMAANGRDGLWMVEAAVAREEPYAVLFCDLRMPGWDGLETVERIRGVDRCVQIIFITAYSDHSVETLVERAGADVGYFVKPFLSDEVKQLATKAVLEWNRARELEHLVLTLASLSGEARDMDRLLAHVLGQICAWLGTDSAALLRLLPDGSVKFQIGVGNLSSEAAAGLMRAAAASEPDAVNQLPDGTTLLPIHAYGVAIALAGKAVVTPERRHLLEVFLEHASLAIRNSEMRAQLLQQERLAAMGKALSFVLHDLRGPVGTAQLTLGALRARPRTDAEREGLFDRLQRQLGRIVAFVTDTLSFTSGEPQLAPERVPLRATIETFVEAWVPELAGVDLVLDLPADLAATLDPHQLERVLWNLTRNAAKASNGRPGARVVIGGTRTPQGVELTVTDNGPGIPEDLRERVFEPFVTRSAGGSGLGLAIVKQIMEAHGGSVRLHPEGGTCFVLFFPSSPEGCVAAQEHG